MYLLDDRIRRRREEAVDVVWPWERLGLRAAIAFEFGPDTGEGEQRPALVEGEPNYVLLGGSWGMASAFF